MIEPKDITKRRFSRLLKAYGANPSRWPECERASAEQFLARHDMSSDLAPEQHIDHWLETNKPGHVPASDSFLDRLLAISKTPQGARIAAPPAFGKIGPGILLHTLSPVAFPARAAVLAIALAAGLWVGTASYGVDVNNAMDLSPWLMGYDLAFYKDTSP